MMDKDEARRLASAGAKADLVANLAWAGIIVAIALAGTWLRKLGVLEAETVTRTVIGANGLMVAWMGNRMPKAFVPHACARRARRFTGWSLALSGLVYAGLFAFAPLSVAYSAGCGVIVLGIVASVCYCVVLFRRDRVRAA